MKTISVIVPCYNEEAALPIFSKELSVVRNKLNPQYNFEIIYINDGSKDHTLDIIRKFSQEDTSVKYISFSRKFGKEAAIYSGLQASTGDYVVMMDADCQDPPALLPEMLHYITDEGYDSVATRRVTRKGEPPIRSFFARMFYRIMNAISETDLVDGARDYRFMNRSFVDALLQLGEYNRFSKGLFGWVGFKTKWLEYENVERVAGETKWSFWKLFRYSVEGIVGFSTVPLTLSSVFGVLSCIFAFLFMLFIIVRRLCFGDPVAGWASTATIILFLGGVQLLSIGILGQYLAKTYLEVKRRPIFIVKETDINE